MSDFCYSRPMLDRVLRQSELMDRMIEHMGVDPAAAARLDGGTAWYEARTRCIACHAERQCEAWLARTPRGAQAPAFCHNARFFGRCFGADRKRELVSTAAGHTERGASQ